MAIKTSENEGWLSCKIRSERIAKEEESRVSLAPVVSKQPPDFHPNANEVTNRGIWLALVVIVARKGRGSSPSCSSKVTPTAAFYTKAAVVVLNLLARRREGNVDHPDLFGHMGVARVYYFKQHHSCSSGQQMAY